MKQFSNVWNQVLQIVNDVLESTLMTHILKSHVFYVERMLTTPHPLPDSFTVRTNWWKYWNAFVNPGSYQMSRKGIILAIRSF